MSKLIRNIIILTALLFVADRGIGWILEHEFYKQKHGDAQVTTYLLDSTKEDILILGGSRASHHYIPSVISDSLHLSCYNAGRDEMTIIYSNAVLPIIYKRYSPKYVILDLVPTELNSGKEKDIVTQRISTVLLPYYSRHNELLSTISLAGKYESMKLLISKIYPYNSLPGTIVQNTYTKIGHSAVQGYEPLYSVIDTATYKEPMWANFTENTKVDSSLQNILENIITITKSHNTKLVLVISPFYFDHNFSRNNNYNTIKKLARDNDVLFLDFMHTEPFLGNPLLFNDDVHLNDSGAHIYSKMFAQLLKNQ